MDWIELAQDRDRWRALMNKIEKNQMSGACSAYGGEERRIQGYVGET